MGGRDLKNTEFGIFLTQMPLLIDRQTKSVKYNYCEAHFKAIKNVKINI